MSERQMTLQEKLAFVGRPESLFTCFQELRHGQIETPALKLAAQCFDYPSTNGTDINFAIQCVARVLWLRSPTEYHTCQLGFMASGNSIHVALLEINHSGRFGKRSPTVRVWDGEASRTLALDSASGLFDVFEAILDCEVAFFKRGGTNIITVLPHEPWKRDSGIVQGGGEIILLMGDPQDSQLSDDEKRRKRGRTESEFMPFIPQSQRWCETWAEPPPFQMEFVVPVGRPRPTGPETISTWHLVPDPGEYVDRVRQMLTKAISLLRERSVRSTLQMMRLRRELCGGRIPTRVNVSRERGTEMPEPELKDEIRVKYSGQSLETTIDHVREESGQKRWITTVWLHDDDKPTASSSMHQGNRGQGRNRRSRSV